MMRHVLLGGALMGALAAQMPKLPKLGGVGGRGTPTSAGSGTGSGGRVKAELDQAERALDTCGKLIEGGKAPACDKYHVKFDDSIGDAKRALGNNLSGAAGEALSRIQSLETKKAEQAKAMESAAAALQATSEKLTSGDAIKDGKTIEALREFYKNFGGLTQPPSEETMVTIQSWPRTKIDVEDLLKKYPVVKSRQGLAPEAHDMVNQVRLLDSAHKLALANVDKAMLSLPANVERTIEEARTRIERAKADKALFGGALLAQEQIEGVEQMLKVYAIIGAEHPKNNVTFAGGTREKLAVLNAEVDKLAAELIAANEPPADNYRGGDAAALKEMLRKVWATNYPTVKIVRIGLRGDWNRAGGYKWEGNQESWLKFDASRLAGWMVIDTGHNKFVYLRSANLYRDHTNGDRTEARVQMYDPKEKVHPGQTYLKTKL